MISKVFFLLHFCCCFSVKLVNLEYLQIVILDIFLLKFTPFVERAAMVYLAEDLVKHLIGRP